MSGLGLEWRSLGYIENGNPLQFSTANMIGANAPSIINGRVTATATLTNNTLDNGVRVLESMLRITAVEASTVTCRGTSGDTLSIEFSILGTCSSTRTLCEIIVIIYSTGVS